MESVIFETDDSMFRIIEVWDEYADLGNLEGDVYNPKHFQEMGFDSVEAQASARREFVEHVNSAGVYGYVLERWDQTPGVGWSHVDSCFGFVGQYSKSDEIYNHYIVDEMINTIESERNK